MRWTLESDVVERENVQIHVHTLCVHVFATDRKLQKKIFNRSILRCLAFHREAPDLPVVNIMFSLSSVILFKHGWS